jgi:uncharacterized phage protein (TIGR01671 family)
MREIRFRGKDMDSGEWRYGSLTTYPNGRCEIVVFDNGEILEYEVDADSVGQFTGVLDKNGKEIYEGDIIRGNCGNGEVRHLISFYDMIASFVAEMLPDNDINDYCSLSQIWVLKYNKEVIGNIHDNPNLLTDGRD